MKEAIVLAGGKGTRLQSVTKGGQKVVVSVGNKSFLELLLERLDEEKFDRVHLALGHRAADVEKVIGNTNFKTDIHTIHETTPLGTGGAIKNALKHVSTNNVVVLNGDSFNEVNYAEILNTHRQSTADVSVLTKSVPNIDRYGEVQIGPSGKIIAFIEKTGLEKPGNINAGVYVLPGNLFDNSSPDVFSFETFLCENVDVKDICAIASKGSFIDIGVPEDYQKFISIIECKNVYK